MSTLLLKKQVLGLDVKGRQVAFAFAIRMGCAHLTSKSTLRYTSTTATPFSFTKKQSKESDTHTAEVSDKSVCVVQPAPAPADHARNTENSIRQIKSFRTYHVGEVYKPENIGRVATREWNLFSNGPHKGFDIYDAIGAKPQELYKDASFLSLFVNEMGSIMNRRMTKLSDPNQRNTAKMIRRARAMCLMPYDYKMYKDYPC